MTLQFHRWAFSLTLLVVVLLRSTTAMADPITITFAGHWHFHDLGETGPVQLNLEAALATYGVIASGTSSQGQNLVGTPVSFSMVVDPSVPLGPSNQYSGAFLGGFMEVGSLSFRFGQTDMSADRTAHTALIAPSVSANGQVFTAAYGFWRHIPGWQATSLATTFTNIELWPTTSAYISFQPPDTASLTTQGRLGYADLSVVSVSMPEPATWLLMGLGAVGILRRRRLTRKPT